MHNPPVNLKSNTVTVSKTNRQSTTVDFKQNSHVVGIWQPLKVAAYIFGINAKMGISFVYQALYFAGKTSVASISIAKRWFDEFRCGRTDMNNVERYESSIKVASPETIEKIHERILVDRRLKVRGIVGALCIAHG